MDEKKIDLSLVPEFKAIDEAVKSVILTIIQRRKSIRSLQR